MAPGDSSNDDDRTERYTPEEWEALKSQLYPARVETGDIETIEIHYEDVDEGKNEINESVVEAIEELAHDPRVWGLLILLLANQLIWAVITFL